jgi:hypothetical protein
MRATCPSILIILDLIILIIFDEAYVQTFSSAPWSETPSNCVPSLEWQIEFHTHTETGKIFKANTALRSVGNVSTSEKCVDIWTGEGRALWGPTVHTRSSHVAKFRQRSGIGQGKSRRRWQMQRESISLVQCVSRHSPSCSPLPELRATLLLDALMQQQITITIKVKGKVVTVLLFLTEHHAMKAYWESGSIAPLTLTSALDGCEWSASRPGRFTPNERDPATYWIWDCVGPTASRTNR